MPGETIDFDVALDSARERGVVRGEIVVQSSGTEFRFGVRGRIRAPIVRLNGEMDFGEFLQGDGVVPRIYTVTNVGDEWRSNADSCASSWESGSRCRECLRLAGRSDGAAP